MKAVLYERYGGPEVLRIGELPVPVPADDEILIRIHAVSLNGSDREALIGEPAYARLGGLRKPRHPVLGSDIAGRVEAVGRNHTEFQPGDDVFGELPGYRNGLAQFACTHGRTLLRKPAALTFAQAAAIPQGGAIAHRAICVKGAVQPGQRVLINGAGGSAGTFAVQLAKMRGAEVTGVDNGGKQDFMLSLGADHVIDSDRADFTALGRQYDLVLDVIAHRSVHAHARAIARNGNYLFVGGSARVIFETLLLGPLIGAIGGKRLRMLVVPQNRQDLIAITDLCVTGQVTPIIDKEYSMENTPDACARLADGRAHGKVVIRVA